MLVPQVMNKAERTSVSPFLDPPPTLTEAAKQPSFIIHHSSFISPYSVMSCVDGQPLEGRGESTTQTCMFQIVGRAYLQRVEHTRNAVPLTCGNAPSFCLLRNRRHLPANGSEAVATVLRGSCFRFL